MVSTLISSYNIEIQALKKCCLSTDTGSISRRRKLVQIELGDVPNLHIHSIWATFKYVRESMIFWVV